ncbi:MAG: hypothetical protein JNL12_10140 [Planctomycetes bacterium]|nr:hypothetical protein [Planctomycetota bacterium]
MLAALLTGLLGSAPQQPNDAPTAASPTPPPIELGLAARYPGDVGIAGDPAVRFATGFEDGFAGWTRQNPRIFTLVDDPTLAHGGGRCALATATRGKDTGGEITWRTEDGHDRLFVRFYCRFAPDAVWPHHFVKLRALAPGWDGPAGAAPPGDKGFWTGIEPLRGRWRFYTYWHAMRGFDNPGPTPGTNDDGTEPTAKNDFYGNGFTPDGQAEVPRDRWICVEAMLQANTPGECDGAMAFWIDGVRVGDYRTGTPVGQWLRNVWITSGPRLARPVPFPGFDFRTTSALRVNEVGLLWYVSDEYAKLGTAERNRVWFDDVVVATEYIGPRGVATSTSTVAPETPR